MEDSSIPKVNCWNRLKYISCSLWIRIFLFNLMWTFNSNDSFKMEIERKNSMMNKLSFHWNWYFIWKKIIFSTGRKEDFNQIWWFRFISLIIQLNSSSWKESFRWKNEFHQLKNSIQDKQTFIQNNQIEKIHLFTIDFILSPIVVFIIFINLKQKYDEIHWIDYFWIILVKKRIFCLFNCFLGWRKERKWKVFLCFSNCFFGYKTFFYLTKNFKTLDLGFLRNPGFIKLPFPESGSVKT